MGILQTKLLVSDIMSGMVMCGGLPLKLGVAKTMTVRYLDSQEKIYMHFSLLS